MTRHLRLAVLLCITLPTTLLAQKSISYFADTVQKGPHSRIFCAQRSQQYVYVGGESFDSAGVYYTPSVVKLDTAGNTIWSCTLNKQIDQVNGNSGGTVYWAGYIQNMTIDDSSVYAHCYAIGTGIHEIWRISQATGDVIWKKNVADAMVVAVANSSQIAYSYDYGSNYMYELVDKATGKSILSKVISPSVPYPSNCFFSFDTDGSAYIVKGDSIIKYSDAQLTTLSWNKKIGSPGGISSVKAETDGLFFFGNGNTFFAGKLNKADGTRAWLSGATYNSNVLQDFVSDFKIYNNNIYVSGEAQYTGAYSAYHVCVFNRNTGHLSWESEFNPQWTPSPSTSAGDASGNSLDADALGNVYVSGYEYGSNSRLGIWGICKFDSTGRLVYHNSVFDGAPYTSQYSRGMFTFVFDNRVFHFGELQRSQVVPNPEYNSSYCNVYLAATDTSSAFNPYHRVTTRAGYQEFSNVLDIANFSSGKYAVLKQVGPSVAVELRDAAQGNVLWTRKIKRGWYLAADKMCITADNKIAFTAISHDGTQMFYDYSNNPDSIYFFRLDSSGVLTQEKKYSIQSQKDFRSIQFYANKDSNNVLVYSQVDHYGNDLSIHLFNVDKATGNVGDFAGYLSSVYAPVPGKQTLISSLYHDSALHFQSYMKYYSLNQLIYEVYTFKTANAGGYINPSFKLSGGFKFVAHNLVPCDSSSLIVLSTDNASGAPAFVRYNFAQRAVLWSTIDPVSSYQMDMGSCSSTKLYLAGRKGNSLVIRQSSIADGSKVWEKLITPASANQYYVPMDQKFNSQRKQYTIAGYIADTTAITATQSAFYITVDTNGIIVNQWVQAGDYNQKNSLNAVNVTQFGQTLIGGALYKAPYGRSGVLIEADSAFVQSSPSLTVSISVSPSNTVCAGDSVRLIANAPACVNCSYSWSTIPSVKSDTLIVKTSGAYTVMAISGTDTASASQVITVNISPQPVISLSGGNLSSSSASGNQWYLNGQPVAGATSQQLKPAVSGSYTVQVLQGGCQSPVSAPFVYTAPAGNSPFTVTITASPSDTVCMGDSVTLTASAPACSGCTYSWSGAPSVKGASIVARISGSYTVTATNGTDSASAMHSVVVSPVPPKPTILGFSNELMSSSSLGNKWYLNGLPMADSISHVITPSATGLYTVQTQQNGCPSPMSAPYSYTLSATSTASSGVSDSVVFYPNPVRNILHIANRQMRAIHITVYDLYGAKFAEVSGSGSDQTINMGPYARGGYYIMITDDKTGKQRSVIISKL